MIAGVSSSPAWPGRAVRTLPASHAHACAAAPPCAAVALPSAAAQGVMRALSPTRNGDGALRSDDFERTATGTAPTGPLPGGRAAAGRVREQTAGKDISLTRLAPRSARLTSLIPAQAGIPTGSPPSPGRAEEEPKLARAARLARTARPPAVRDSGRVPLSTDRAQKRGGKCHAGVPLSAQRTANKQTHGTRRKSNLAQFVQRH